MSIAFVIGNGLSRKNIDLKTLNGTTIGCNAIYRSFMPDHLVMVDERMVKELLEVKDFTKYNKVYLQPKFKTKYNEEGLDFKEIPPGSIYGSATDSGLAAFRLAVLKRYKTIYLLGFDFAYNTSKGETNNIYAGTNGYSSYYPANKLKSSVIKLLMKECTMYKDVSFIRVIEEGVSYNFKTSHRLSFQRLPKPSNYKEITVEEFKCQHHFL